MNEKASNTSAAATPESVTPNSRSIYLFARTWFLRTIPTLAVLAALGSVAAWGHHSGWKLPKFSALVGGSSVAGEEWCQEHSVPEAMCVECNPAILPRGPVHDFCQTHGVPECPADHPDVAQVYGPRQFPRYDVLAALSLLERPENNRRCKLHERRIQFASAAAAEKAGVDVEVVQEIPMEEAVAAAGEIAYDQTRVARLSARVPGTVWRVEKQVGDAVRAGDVLAFIDAAEVGRAKGELLQALVQFRLKGKTFESLERTATAGAVPDRQVREAETAFSEARIRLLGAQQSLINLGLPIATEEWLRLPEEQIAARIRFVGIPAELADKLDPRATPGNLLLVKSPLDGVVVTREIVAGEVVDNSRLLFVVADTRCMSLTLNVRLEDVPHLTLGEPVRFRPDGSDREVVGSVGWFSTSVDEKTRTVKVRADLPNPDGRLRSNTFGAGRIMLREEKHAVAVPRQAIHWDGDCFIVFVRDKDYLKEGAPKVFHVRKVRPGAQDEKYTEILAGLLLGELVASKGSAVLKAELLKGTLGEG